MIHPTNRRAYWEAWYQKDEAPKHPTSFALFVEEQLPKAAAILELGCGNARDTAFFAQQGHPVIAIDASETAIANNTKRFGHLPCTFLPCDFADLGSLTLPIPINALYSRFVLHAIPEPLEENILDYAATILPHGAWMFHEFRTTNDPLMREGTSISANERLCGHYRRFIDLGAFTEKLAKKGFSIESTFEGRGVAVLGKSDPVVARVAARKP